MKAFAASAVALLVACAVLSDVHAQDSSSGEPEILPCESHKSCRECAADINCGWCASDDACYEGVELGPILKQCSQWTHTFCHDEPCEERKDCHSCLTNSECGWCAATATCETGTAKRSEQSACPPARWMHKLGNRKLQCEKANALFLGDAAAEKEEAEG